LTPGDIPTVKTLDDLADFVAGHPGVCVRYSKGPEHDRGRPSVDYESGLELPGLSCNPLEPEDWWARDVRDWFARQICHYADLGDEPGRRAWLIVGTENGRGPDREPLLEPWQPVAFLSDALIDEARRRYHDRFEVGRDSTGNGTGT
jgi:hypothetical protein